MLRVKQLLALVLCMMLLVGCTQTAPVETVEFISDSKKDYKTTIVVKGPINITLEARASSVYLNTKTVTLEYDNAILKEDVSFYPGDVIHAGDVLATVTFEASEAELERMELAYYEANKSAADRIASYESRIAQYAAAAAAGGIDGEIAALQKEKAENELTIYRESAYKQLNQQLDALEAYREKFTEKVLVAPEDGVVTQSISFKAEKVLSKGAVLLNYTADGATYLRLDSVGEEFKLMATPGMEIKLGRGDVWIDGTIAASPTGIDDSLNNQYIYIDAPELDKIGEKSYYNVEFSILSVEDVLLLQKKALRTDGNEYYVMVLQNGVPIKQKVTVILESDDMVCIQDGLTEGQQVVIGG